MNHRPLRRPTWLRRPAPTVRTRLTLTYAALFTVGGTFLLFALTFAFYRSIFRPMAPDQIPSRFDPDHDRFVDLSDQIRSAATEHLLRDAFLLLLIVVAVSAFLGWWVAGRMLRPIAAITAAARRAGQATLQERLNLTGPDDELKELGDTFDAMLERLDTAFAAQRRFIANASHELRTPLAVTRTATEVTLAKPHPTPDQWRAMAHDVARATDRAQQLIDSLLVLAGAEQRLTDVADDDLADITAEALDRVAAEIRDRGLRLEASLAPALLEGDLGLLEIAVANLVDNAVKYTPATGTVRVATRTVNPPEGAEHLGPRAELVVANDGPLLDPATVDRLLEPFHRGDHTRLSATRGAGLGLSIVSAVTTAHHGCLTLTARPRGGLTVTVVLPRRNRTDH